jgi:hypothetical protein
LVDHLGGGHSQSVLLAMKKLLKNSATSKGACPSTHGVPITLLYNIFIIYYLLYFYSIFWTWGYLIIIISIAKYFVSINMLHG